MAAQDIEYIELYTADKKPTIDYFVSALGFAEVAHSADDGANNKESVLLRQGSVQLVVSTGPGTSAFLNEHGDGIADIALTCDDVAASCEAAVAAGATEAKSARGLPVVSGPGGTWHTLLPAARGAATRLPEDRHWITKADRPDRPTGRIGLLDHVAICVEGSALAEYADFYWHAFGMTRYSSAYVDIGASAMDSIVVRNQDGGVTFTLVAPDTRKSPGQLDAFLERNNGPGVQHLAFGVDDIIPAVSEARERGVEFLQAPATYYDMLSERFPAMGAEIADLRAASVLADRDEWGYLLQLFTRSPYKRNTLFYEFIQRRGARGFGTANIRALYEAVERDRLAAE
jgi:4-hydroxymandelate synthase